jgi:hypothetical protein
VLGDERSIFIIGVAGLPAVKRSVPDVGRRERAAVHKKMRSFSREEPQPVGRNVDVARPSGRLALSGSMEE